MITARTVAVTAAGTRRIAVWVAGAVSSSLLKEVQSIVVYGLRRWSSYRYGGYKTEDSGGEAHRD